MDQATFTRVCGELYAKSADAHDEYAAGRISKGKLDQLTDESNAEFQRARTLFKSRARANQFAGSDSPSEFPDGWATRKARSEFDPSAVGNPKVAVKHKGGFKPPSVADASPAQLKSLFEAGKSDMRGFRTATAWGDQVQVKDAGSWAERGDVGMKTSWTQTVPTSVYEGTSGQFLPPELMPSAFYLRYEPTRLFDYFIGARGESQSVTWLQHTSNTNPAAAVAELTQKPDLGPIVTPKTATFSTIAGIASCSRQMFDDFPDWSGTIPHELQTALIDAENDQVLNGNGSAPNMLGLINTTGKLTRVCPSITGVAYTQIDAIVQAIADLRVGSAYAVADLVVLNPADWSEIKRIKNSLGSFVLNSAEPSEIGGYENIFGVPVAQTTKIASGTAVVLDTKIAVLGFVRQGVEIMFSPYGDWAFQNNAVQFRGEMRETVGVAYPSAVCVVTNLNQGSDWTS